MTESYQIDSANRLIMMARFLLTEADTRGLTHGEKHYLIQTALMLLAKAQNNDLGYSGRAGFRNEVTEIPLEDIPTTERERF